MKEAAQPLMDLATRPSVIPSPKLNAISTSARPHVRIEVVTYDPYHNSEGQQLGFTYHGRRIDLSIPVFKRLVKTMPFGRERTELTETLKSAGLWK